MPAAAIPVLPALGTLGAAPQGAAPPPIAPVTPATTPSANLPAPQANGPMSLADYAAAANKGVHPTAAAVPTTLPSIPKTSGPPSMDSIVSGYKAAGGIMPAPPITPQPMPGQPAVTPSAAGSRMSAAAQSLLGSYIGPSGCATAVGRIAKLAGLPVPNTANAGDFESQLPKFGWQAVPASESDQAQIVTMKGSGGAGNPSGRHVAVHIGGGRTIGDPGLASGNRMAFGGVPSNDASAKYWKYVGTPQTPAAPHHSNFQPRTATGQISGPPQDTGLLGEDSKVMGGYSEANRSYDPVKDVTTVKFNNGGTVSYGNHGQIRTGITPPPGPAGGYHPLAPDVTSPQTSGSDQSIGKLKPQGVLGKVATGLTNFADWNNANNPSQSIPRSMIQGAIDTGKTAYASGQHAAAAVQLTQAAAKTTDLKQKAALLLQAAQERGAEKDLEAQSVAGLDTVAPLASPIARTAIAAGNSLGSGSIQPLKSSVQSEVGVHGEENARNALTTGAIMLGLHGLHVQGLPGEAPTPFQIPTGPMIEPAGDTLARLKSYLPKPGQSSPATHGTPIATETAEQILAAAKEKGTPAPATTSQPAQPTQPAITVKPGGKAAPVPPVLTDFGKGVVVKPDANFGDMVPAMPRVIGEPGGRYAPGAIADRAANGPSTGKAPMPSNEPPVAAAEVHPAIPAEPHASIGAPVEAHPEVTPVAPVKTSAASTGEPQSLPTGKFKTAFSKPITIERKGTSTGGGPVAQVHVLVGAEDATAAHGIAPTHVVVGSTFGTPHPEDPMWSVYKADPAGSGGYIPKTNIGLGEKIGSGMTYQEAISRATTLSKVKPGTGLKVHDEIEPPTPERQARLADIAAGRHVKSSIAPPSEIAPVEPPVEAPAQTTPKRLGKQNAIKPVAAPVEAPPVKVPGTNIDMPEVSPASKVKITTDAGTAETPTPMKLGKKYNPITKTDQSDFRNMRGQSADTGEPGPESPLAAKPDIGGGSPSTWQSTMKGIRDAAGQKLADTKQYVKDLPRTIKDVATQTKDVGSNLNMLKAYASPETIAKAHRLANYRARAAVLIHGPYTEIARLMHFGKGPVSFNTVLMESRLRGIRSRWGGMAKDVASASDDDIVKTSTDNHGNTTGHVDPRWMGPLKALADTREQYHDLDNQATSLASENKIGEVRTLLAKAFSDARNTTGRVMPKGAFDKEIQKDTFQKALAIYKEHFEPELAKTHQSNEGVFSDNLGPLDTYYPLLRMSEDGEPIHIAAGGGEFAQPRNAQNSFATGQSPEYDTSVDGLANNLRGAFKRNAQSDLMQSLENDGLLQKPGDANRIKEKGKPDKYTITIKGKDYPANFVQTNKPKLIVGHGDTVSVGASIKAAPSWLIKEMGPLVHSTLPEWGGTPIGLPEPVSKVINAVNQSALIAGPEAIYHSKNLISTAISEVIPEGTAAKVLGASPLTKAPVTVAQIVHTNPMSDVNLTNMREMAEAGVIPERYGSETRDKQIATVTGAHYNPASLAPELFGRTGVDIRSRLYAWRQAKASFGLNPDAPLARDSDGEFSDPKQVQQMAERVNHFGIYNRALEGALQRFLKDSGFGPWATAATTMTRNGVRMWANMLNFKDVPGGSAAQQVAASTYLKLSGGVAGMVSLWAMMHHETTGKWPWEDPNSRFLEIPISPAVQHSAIGKNILPQQGKIYVSLPAILNPLIDRGASTLGIKGYYDTFHKTGSTDKASESALRGPLNSGLHIIAGGPAASTASVALTGNEPYITSLGQGYGRNRKVGAEFLPADQTPTQPGLKGQLASRGRALIGHANSFANVINQDNESPALKDSNKLWGALFKITGIVKTEQPSRVHIAGANSMSIGKMGIGKL